MQASLKISKIWPEPPSDECLHVFVKLPAGAKGSPSLVYVGVCFICLCPSSGYLTNVLPEGDVDSVLVREYNNLFIKVNEWGTFEDSDIEWNGLREYVHDGTVPDFVAEAE